MFTNRTQQKQRMGLTNSTPKKRKGSNENEITNLFNFLLLFFSLIAQDRSHSPGSQHDESASSSPQESDFKKAKDATGSDQQVPTTENLLRDPNVVALERLEQVKQNLVGLNEQVDAFTGSTRDDRIYRNLDEQAVKMMLLCDELVDVSAEIKEKRKEMIQNVQTVVAKLESKVPINPPIESNSNENMLQIIEPTIDTPAST